MLTRTRTADQKDEVEKSTSPNYSFFPIPEDFSDYLGIPLSELQGSKKVLVSLDLLRILIGLAAAGTAYDPKYYKEKYQDLREAHEEGRIADLCEHYISQGYFEKRVSSKEQAFPVDEAWYLETYPDVAAGIRSGSVDSAPEHYFATGRKEGRLPSGQIPQAIQNLISRLKQS